MALRLDATFLIRKMKDLRNLTFRRHRFKEKWAASHPKHPATSLAQQQFDITYNTQLGQLWPSVRVALLSEKKYGALLNNFCSDALVEDLLSLGCRDFLTDINTKGVECDSEGGASLPHLSPNIKCVVFPRGDITRFKQARPDASGLLSHYLMDAASVLPCLALDVLEGHNVLDLCAAPGGKTLALLQTQAIGFLCLNDASVSRTSRLRKVLHSFIPKALLNPEKLRVTSLDGTKWGEIEHNTFDRVLVDVPCTMDRHSLMEDDNNIFNKSRTVERRRLPQLQLDLLMAGVAAACPGGEIVYSTCTLSHIQNVGVVQQAIHLAQENHGIQLQVVDLRPLTHMFRNTFDFAPGLHVGEMVIPHLTANFGPIYMCKLRRLT
nr:5-methylcytosine rRNA methyltransferase NSUN4-like [Nerophis lumbriciformis]